MAETAEKIFRERTTEEPAKIIKPAEDIKEKNFKAPIVIVFPREKGVAFRRYKCGCGFQVIKMKIQEVKTVSGLYCIACRKPVHF